MKSYNLKTVCLALGPYRNLTTLTGSLLFLHPKCQVLNHGSDHILPNPDVNFLIEYTDEKFEEFVRYAIELSAEGKRGRYGGSITLSHAFDNQQMREAYRRRFQDTRIKEDIDCLFWKESLRVSSYIRQHEINLDFIFSRNSQLRFLMPIRNPMDCTLSNMKTGHAQFLTGGAETSTFIEVLSAILLEIKWFFDLQEKYPGRFFCFFENEFDRVVVDMLAHFLEIEAEPVWVDEVLRNYEIRHPYDHTRPMKKGYAELVNRYFEPFPEMRKRLQSFID